LPASARRASSQSLRGALVFALTLAWAGAAPGQSIEYELDSGGSVRAIEAPPVGSDVWTVAEARRLIVDGQPDRAERLLTRWLDEAEQRAGIPDFLMAEALLARGDARVADRDEFEAFFDYEELIREYPETEAFGRAIEREVEIAIAYADGMRRKLWGLRILDATDVAIEILIRTQERLPGSALAERAAIELADHFYERREIALAGEAYGLYVENFPNGAEARRAARRQIYTDIARFRGPRYDASMLLDAQVRIRRFMERFPADAERRGINAGLIDRLDESLAAQLLASAEWYLDVGEDASARLTMRRLIDRYPATLAAKAAARMLEERGWALPSQAAGDGQPSAADESSESPEGNPADATTEAPTRPPADGGADDTAGAPR
jgi:hypothetical protein